MQLFGFAVILSSKRVVNKLEFVEQTKADFLPLRRAQLYAPFRCIAFGDHISKRASECRMPVCLLLDKWFLKNPPAKRRGLFSFMFGSTHQVVRTHTMKDRTITITAVSTISPAFSGSSGCSGLACAAGFAMRRSAGSSLTIP